MPPWSGARAARIDNETSHFLQQHFQFKKIENNSMFLYSYKNTSGRLRERKIEVGGRVFLRYFEFS